MKPSRRNVAKAKQKKIKPALSKYAKKFMSPEQLRKMEAKL